MKDQLNSISADSFDISTLKEIYNCDTESELIGKLTHTLFYHDMFLLKLNDLAFILSLRFNRDLNNTNNYQDTHSRLFYIKSLVEQLLNKIKVVDDEEEEKNLSDRSLHSDEDNKSQNHIDSIIESEIMQCKDIFEFLELPCENTMINQIKVLINHNLNAIKAEFSDLISRHGGILDKKSITSHQYKDVFIKEKLVLCNITMDKKNDINELNKRIRELEGFIESQSISNISHVESLQNANEENLKIRTLLGIIEVSK